MNYQKIYNQLIAKRQQNPISKKNGYCERHHIIPKSLGGTNNKDNLVNLTAREHFIAHRLLEKITKEQYGENSKEHEQMVCALWYTIHGDGSKLILNSRSYEQVKKIFGQAQSARVSGEKNPMYGRKGKLSPVFGISPFANFTDKEMDDYREAQRISHLGKPAWNKGKKGFKQSEETCKKLSIANSGENNPMYGHSVTEFMTDEEIANWRKNISKNSKGRKHMYHPITLENINPKLEDVQKYLNLGYVFGQHNKTKHKKRTPEQRKHISEKHWKPLGYKHMYNPITLEQRLVNPTEFAKFTELGFVFGQLNKKKLQLV